MQDTNGHGQATLQDVICAVIFAATIAGLICAPAITTALGLWK